MVSENTKLRLHYAQLVFILRRREILLIIITVFVYYILCTVLFIPSSVMWGFLKLIIAVNAGDNVDSDNKALNIEIALSRLTGP